MDTQGLSNRNGQFLQKDFPNNTGGTNLTDSVFRVQETQAAGGYNFDYGLTGGVRKRLGPAKINTVADSQLYTLGFGQLAPVSNLTKSIIRAAGTKLQLFDTSAPSFTALTKDTLVNADPFTAGSIQDVQFTQFSNGTSDILWGAGGGATLPVGAYSTTKYTVNGVNPTSGSVIATPSASGTGNWTAAGKYYYAFVYHKTSTGAISNAASDVTATTANTTDIVTLNLTGIVAADTTLYDQIWIYRSAINGVTSFTTGNLVTKVASSATSFVDKGDLGNPDLQLVVNVPRAGNIVLDNSVLPAGTYNVLTLWGHRLATASGNILYVSDVNKSESWPLTNIVTVPSAGPITALAVISFTSPQANSLQELLVIFKDTELWVLSPGASNDYTTWSLLKIDNVGCPQQSLIVPAQGYIAWVNYRGVHIWDGSSKPTYCSRLIEPLFSVNGDLDKTRFNEGVGAFFKRENQIIWYLSSKTYGDNKLGIKLDVRLTLSQVEQTLTGRNLDAVLIEDVYAFPVYAAFAYNPLNGAQEQMLLGDNAGFCYFASNTTSDGGANFNFTYLTPPLHMGDPNTEKQFHKVVVWVADVGNWNLYLDYWSDYRFGDMYQTTQALPISTENGSGTALWDVALWDVAFWDAYIPGVVPIVFNLQAGHNNSCMGKALQVQFRNGTADQPVVIHGFSVIYSLMGGITA